MSEGKAIELAKKVLKSERQGAEYDEIRAVQNGDTPVWNVYFVKNGKRKTYVVVPVEVNF